MRPLRVGRGELAAALGGIDPVAALRGPVLAAMPTVARFEARGRQLDMLERAEEIVAHRFDLLGSGPTELGPEIDWAQDFKTGRRWPLHHGSLLAGRRTATAPTSRCRGSCRASSTCRSSPPPG